MLSRLAAFPVGARFWTWCSSFFSSPFFWIISEHFLLKISCCLGTISTCSETGLCNTIGMESRHQEHQSPPAGPLATLTSDWLCHPLLGYSYVTQLSQCTHLENSPKAKSVVFHCFGSLNQFSTKVGTRGMRAKEEVEERRRKGTASGHDSETLGHLICTQTIRKVGAGVACSLGVCRSGIYLCDFCRFSVYFPQGVLHLGSSAVIWFWHWAVHKFISL